MNTKYSILKQITAAALIEVALGTDLLPAAPVPRDQVGKAVETWVRRVTAEKRVDARIARMEPWPAQGETAAYVIHLANGGFCLAGADSFSLPVYWYSPTGTFDPSNPGLQEILNEIAGRVQFLRREVAQGGKDLEAHRDTLRKRARDWNALAEGEDTARTGADAGAASDHSGETVVLPLSSQWGQGSPYNDACPEIPAGSGNHALVGCVATAAAQIMRYWEWPASYDWKSIKDSHTTPVDPADSEIARLCHDIGLAVDMNYGTSLSLANTADVEDALPRDFGYDPDTVYGALNVSTMVEELSWFRPIQMRGSQSKNGHSWVVFGYNLSTNPWQFKLNMGWNGSSDGWWSVDNVPSGYTTSQEHVTQIAPQSAVRFVGSNSLGDGSPNAPFLNLEAAIASSPDKTVLVLKANSINTFASESLVMNRPFTLKGVHALIK